MKAEWQFVTEVVDAISDKHTLHTLFGVTRFQAYRDVMTKGECFACTGIVYFQSHQTHCPPL